MNNLFERLFAGVYFLMRLSMLYFILVACGGIVFGLAPANATLLYLYGKYRRDVSSYRFATAWEYYRQHFLQNNVVLYLCSLGGVGLLGALWFLSQMAPSIWFILGVVCDGAMLAYLLMVYVSFLKLQGHYDFTLTVGLKLAVVSVFFSWKVVVKVLLGSAISLLLLQRLPLVLAVFLPVIWLLFLYDVTEPLCQKVEETIR